jgi:hypothetical protein
MSLGLEKYFSSGEGKELHPALKKSRQLICLLRKIEEGTNLLRSVA